MALVAQCRGKGLRGCRVLSSTPAAPGRGEEPPDDRVKAAGHLMLTRAEKCLQILNGMNWLHGPAKHSFADACLWVRDDRRSTFIALRSGEEEQDIKTNIAKPSRRYRKLWSELCGKPGRKKWKGKSSEKTTCYESCTMTIDKQDKEKKLQRSQVPADPRGKRRREQKWRTGLPFEKTTLNPDLSYPVENHTLLFLWQIFSLSDAAQGDYLCRHTNVTFIFRHWYSPLLYIHILHFLHF